jgi:1-acyl-sn-glycerol-3-phosphate acyltransferase
VAARLWSFLRGARSFLCLLGVGLGFLCFSVWLRLHIVPAAHLFRKRRPVLVSRFMKGVTRMILFWFELGGARFRRVGRLPTDQPVLVVMNHQALTDILQVTLLSDPLVPAFVTRTRYQWFIPLVSQSCRLLNSPFVNPKRDARRAIQAVAEAARTQTHGLLIFPEGHRTRTGEVGSFRAGGLQAILAARRTPVYVGVNEGVWKTRRFVDTLFGLHQIDAYSEVFGPFDPPEDPAELPAFIKRLRDMIVDRLRQIREERAASQGSSGERLPRPPAA